MYYGGNENRTSWISVGMLIGIIIVLIYFMTTFTGSITTLFTNMTNTMNSVSMPVASYSDSFVTAMNNTANNLQSTYNAIEPYITNPYFIIFLLGMGLIVAALSIYSRPQ